MTFNTVAIIGAGTMGSGIATNIAQHGIKVRLIDTSDELVAKAIKSIGAFFDQSAEKGRMNAGEAIAAKEKITGGTNVEDAEGADLIIEAVFEQFDLKAELLKQLNPILNKSTVVATNTSCLTVSSLADFVDDPSRFLGLHYFNPAAINPIVEVVRGHLTRSEIVNAASIFCRQTSKRAIMCKDSYGFALNRFFVPYTNEASRIFEEGLGSPAQINRITEKSMGVAAGPFVVMNLVGMQTMANAAENLEPLGDFYKPTNIVKEMGATKGKWNLGEDNALNEEIASQIIGRLWGAIFLPILQELDEEVASPSEIDMGAGLALRFGTPPCAAMDKFGQAKVKNLIAYHCNRYGVTKPKCLDRVGFLLE